MEKTNQRIKLLERDLKKMQDRKAKAKDDDDDDSDDDDDDIDDTEGIQIELEELRLSNRQRQDKLDEYEKNKTWNVDNMFQVKEERTVINPNAGKTNYTASGHAQSTIDPAVAKQKLEQAAQQQKQKSDNESSSDNKPETAITTTTTTTATATAKEPETASKPASSSSTSTTKKPVAGPSPPTKPTTAAMTSKPPSREEENDPDFIYSYHEFTERYADLMEDFMKINAFSDSREFLLKNGDILLQENAANYMLLASLEDEMNGLRDNMKQRAKQSQIITNIAELAKSWNTHPGNVIVPFFQRLEQREFLQGFLAGVEEFVQKIISRAVVKKKEIDLQREQEQGASSSSSSGAVNSQGVDLADIPREQRLGPGGLDPLEVIESLPESMQKAFETREIDDLKKALMEMDPKDAEYHMKRCVDSGLWNQG